MKRTQPSLAPPPALAIPMPFAPRRLVVLRWRTFALVPARQELVAKAGGHFKHPLPRIVWVEEPARASWYPLPESTGVFIPRDVCRSPLVPFELLPPVDSFVSDLLGAGVPPNNPPTTSRTVGGKVTSFNRGEVYIHRANAECLKNLVTPKAKTTNRARSVRSRNPLTKETKLRILRHENICICHQ